MRCALRRWNPFRNSRLRRRSLRRLRCPSTSGRCFRSTRRTKPCSNPVPMPFPDPRSMRRRNPQSRFPNPIRRSRPILPGRLPGGIPIRRRPEWRSLRRRIQSRNLRGNPDLSLIPKRRPKRRPKRHSSPENPNRSPNPGRSLRLNPRLCPNRLRSRSLRLNPRLRLNRLRSRSLRPDLPLRLNRSSFWNPLLRQLRNPLLRRNPNTSRPRCSGWRRRPSATVTNSASSCRSTIRPRPPKSPQDPKRRKDRRSVPNLLPVPNLL